MITKRFFGIFSSITGKLWSGSKDKELVGEDMFGNKYYQVYDSDNFPLKREVVYARGYLEGKIDTVWYDWLSGREKLPPNSQDIADSFNNYVKRKTIGDEYEKKDEEMMMKFREAMKKVAKPKQQIFEAGSWKPESNKNKKY